MASTGANAFSALLNGDTSGFEGYKKATGFDAASETGSRGITGNAAAAGLLRSGGTAKALQSYGNDMQNQYANSYLDKLSNQAQMGFNAGNLIAGAGQKSDSSSSSKKGIGGFLGKVGAGIALSDRRLKNVIMTLGKLKSGLTAYVYKYLDGSGPFVGVMADEVARLKPAALGPVINGYQSVDYTNITE
jgi:hypothetical protein